VVIRGLVRKIKNGEQYAGLMESKFILEPTQAQKRLLLFIRNSLANITVNFIGSSHRRYRNERAVMKLFCCTCNADVEARLTDGSEVYGHRTDLYSLPFWKCDTCKCFVGCHHKTADRTKPLGCIPSAQIKTLRSMIHALLDPMWQNKQHSRKFIYGKLTKVLGRQYHTAEIRNKYEADLVIAELHVLRAIVRNDAANNSTP
jgi:hypothetical protein